MRPAQQHLTTDELAARWGLSPRTLQSWRRRGYGPEFMRIGEGPRGRVRYPLRAVRAFETKTESR